MRGILYVHVYLSPAAFPALLSTSHGLLPLSPLCTIPDPVQALREVRRVLKPTGRLLFLEHGRSDDAATATWQDRLNPIQNVIGCGCNLNRPIDQLIRKAGLHIVQLDRFVMEGVPRIGGELYRGVATPDRAGVSAPPETDGR